ncbi:MAG TPA: DNA alkylation repair protein [Syntrophobacteraceae bacterium]|nr:DNA alkylation repair protein [Syntrophobacteraceae bacterium]
MFLLDLESNIEFEMECEEILAKLKSMANPDNVCGMARFGINPHNTLGIAIPALREIAKTVGRDQKLSLDLWESGIHEARLLAAFVGDPVRVTENQMERWAKDFDSWDVCDQVCSNLFDRTPHAYNKAVEWSQREEEFVKRAGYVLMGCLAVHDKTADDFRFLPFFPIIKRGSLDERNFVKKAVNWALRQIGKRNDALNGNAIQCAEDILLEGRKASRWVARDALRELRKRRASVDKVEQ